MSCNKLDGKADAGWPLNFYREPNERTMGGVKHHLALLSYHVPASAGT